MTDWTTGVRLPVGVQNFIFATASRLELRPTQALTQRTLGTLSLGVWRPDGEADHSQIFMKRWSTLTKIHGAISQKAIMISLLSEISGSHDGEYKYDSLLEYSAV
jgi:hypothetical protein